MSTKRLAIAIAKVVAAGAGCAVVSQCGNGPSVDAESTGRASIAITSVPADEACVTVHASGTRIVDETFDVAPSQSTALLLAQLPIGPVVFSGAAYPSACSAVAPGDTANWVSDPASATVPAIGVVDVALTMRRNGRARVTVDFADDDAGMLSDATADRSDTALESSSSDAETPNDALALDVAPACVPSGVDTPAVNFIDSNCDGIDGDIAKAIFAATTGSDDNPGTMSAPNRTAQATLDAAAA